MARRFVVYQVLFEIIAPDNTPESPNTDEIFPVAIGPPVKEGPNTLGPFRLYNWTSMARGKSAMRPKEYFEGMLNGAKIEGEYRH